MKKNQVNLIIIEDDADQRYFMTTLFEPLTGYRVRSVPSLARGIREIQKDRPDVVLININVGLPEDMKRQHNSVEAVEILHRYDPSLAITAYTEGDWNLEEKAIRAGALAMVSRSGGRKFNDSVIAAVIRSKALRESEDQKARDKAVIGQVHDQIQTRLDEMLIKVNAHVTR